MWISKEKKKKKRLVIEQNAQERRAFFPILKFNRNLLSLPRSLHSLWFFHITPRRCQSLW